MRITKRQLRRIIKEDMQAGIDMLNWQEIQVGDLVDVDSEANTYYKVRISQKVEDVSQHSGQPAGPGFIGTDDRGDEIVFPIAEVIPSSYEKYTFGESKMRITKRQLRRIIKEEKAKLLREMIDPEYMREEILSFTDETDADGMDYLLDLIGAPALTGDTEDDLDQAANTIDTHVSGAHAEDLAHIHQELTNAGYLG